MKFQWTQILLGFVLGALVTVPFVAKADLLTDVAKTVASANDNHEPHLMAAIDSLHRAKDHMQQAPSGLHYGGHFGPAMDAITTAITELQKADDSVNGR